MYRDSRGKYQLKAEQRSPARSALPPRAGEDSRLHREVRYQGTKFTQQHFTAVQCRRQNQVSSQDGKLHQKGQHQNVPPPVQRVARPDHACACGKCEQVQDINMEPVSCSWILLQFLGHASDITCNCQQPRLHTSTCDTSTVCFALDTIMPSSHFNALQDTMYQHDRSAG